MGPGHGHGEDGAEEQFPGAVGEQEEAGGGAVAGGPGGEGQAGGQRDTRVASAVAAAEAPEREEHSGKRT